MAQTGNQLNERERRCSGSSEHFRSPHQPPRWTQARRGGNGSLVSAAHVASCAAWRIVTVNASRDKGTAYEQLHQSWPGKLEPYRSLLRGPRLRITGGSHPRLASERRVVGKADG